MLGLTDALTAYKLVWKRRRLLWRALRSRRALTCLQDHTANIDRCDVLLFTCLRNERERLPYFLDHYRSLGVTHFLAVDNASTDKSAELLLKQPDVSLWQTEASYRNARFGLDWMNWLLMRYGHGHWCVLVDADELLVFAHHDRLGLPELTRWLDTQKATAFGALMLDLYPRGPIGAGEMPNDPLDCLECFDAAPYRSRRQHPLQNLWTQGGMRERVFFPDQPERSPTLNKLPLVRWNRRFAFVNSTHSILPRRLNACYDGPGGSQPSGVLLHTKFLPDIVPKAQEDAKRRQHFHDPQRYADYYAHIATCPDVSSEASVEYSGWTQLVDLNVMTPGGFGP